MDHKLSVAACGDLETNQSNLLSRNVCREKVKTFKKEKVKTLQKEKVKTLQNGYQFSTSQGHENVVRDTKPHASKMIR